MCENKYSVIFENVSKRYRIYKSQREKLLDLVLPKGPGKDFYALKNISFCASPGDHIGIIGLNGAGKSTLSSILGGVMYESSGRVEINGSASLFSIGAGLNGNLTGLENIRYKTMMLDIDIPNFDEFTREVIEFADIGEFISMPVKTYSSGMRARLGFAIATQINPDILVIDEGLSVGDQTFTQKCLERTEALCDSGKTIFLVSHGLSMIKSFCSKVIWLEYGEMVAFGDTDEVLAQYQEFLNSYNSMSADQRREYRRGVQKRQGHALLREVEAPQSRAGIRARYGNRPFITLVHEKGRVRILPRHFDFLTFGFGPFPSLFRGDFSSAVGILIMQALLFIILDFGTMPAANLLLCLFTAFLLPRGHLDRMLSERGYRMLSEYEEGQADSELNKKVKRGIVKALLLLIFEIVLTAGMVGGTIVYLLCEYFGLF